MSKLWIIVFFQLQISLPQTSDPQGRREVQKPWNKRKRKRDYFQEKEGKSCEEFRRRKMKLQREESFEF